MSDNVLGRAISGNFREASGYSEKKRLVEECETISVHSLQRILGKNALIAAIRESRPLTISLSEGPAEVWLTYDLHRLPGKREHWSSLEDKSARLWLLCPACWRKVVNLHYYTHPGSTWRSPLLCRGCHGLAYLSVNAGGNRWYREVARPLRRLVREKWKLLAHRNPDMARLLVLEKRLRALREQVRPKGPSAATGRKRGYRDLRLVEW